MSKALRNSKRYHYLLGALLVLLGLSFPLISYAGFDIGDAAWLGLNNVIYESLDLGEGTLRVIGNAILSVAAHLTWLGGSLLDIAVKDVVLEMGSKIRGTGIGQAIEDSWEVIRDISNLAFIFGFVWVGIMTIFDYESANTKRVLASIIIGALLINFSLFFTRVVIDASNLLAVEIHDALVVAYPQVGGDDGGVGLLFADIMGISTIYNTGDSDTLETLGKQGGTWFYVSAALFLLVAAFVFAAGALLLIIRFVALIFIMIFSPILFAATVFPQTKVRAKELWAKLFEYAFFAPIFLLLIYISSKVLEQTVATSGSELGKALQNQGGTLNSSSVVINFVIVTVFLIFALKIAQSFSIYGGDKMVSLGSKISRGARGMAIAGTAGFVGRGVIGRWAADDDKKYEKRGVPETSIRRRFASSLANQKFGKAYSYKQVDEAKEKAKGAKARAGQVEETYDKIQRGTTAPTGEAGDKTRIEMERSVADKNTEQLLAILKKNLSPEEYQKFVASLSSSQFDSLMKAKDTDLDDGAKGKLAKARQAAVEQLFEGNVEDLRKASIDQLTQLGAAYLEDESRVIHLNSSQMDKLKEKLTSTEFGRLNTARTNALEQIARGSDPSHILNQKPGEIAKMPAKVLTQLSDRLPVSALSKIASEGTLSQEDQASIRGDIEGSIQAAPNLSASQAYKDWLENDRIGKQFGK